MCAYVEWSSRVPSVSCAAPGDCKCHIHHVSPVTRDWQVASGMRILLGDLSATTMREDRSFIPKWCRSRTGHPVVKFDSRGRHGQGPALTLSSTGGYTFRPIGIRHTHMRYKARTAFILIFQSERAHRRASRTTNTSGMLAEKTFTPYPYPRIWLTKGPICPFRRLRGSYSKTRSLATLFSKRAGFSYYGARVPVQEPWYSTKNSSRAA